MVPPAAPKLELVLIIEALSEIVIEPKFVIVPPTAAPLPLSVFIEEPVFAIVIVPRFVNV